MDEGSRLAEVKIGLFVLAALLLLVLGSLWIARGTLIGAQRTTYDVQLENSEGIEAGDRVRMAGVAVGRVQQVILRPEQDPPVVLRVSLRSEVPVKVDSRATIAASGVLGSYYLEIAPGSPTAPRLPAGGVIPGASAYDVDRALGQVDRLSERVIALVDQTSELIRQVSRDLVPLTSRMERLLSEENSRNVSAILGRLKQSLDAAGPRLASLLERLDRAAADVELAMRQAPDLAADLARLTENLERVIGPEGERLSGFLASAQRGVDGATDALSLVADNRRELEATLRDLRATAANLKEFSRAVRERPSSLIRSRPAPDRRPGDGVRRDRR